MRNAHRWVPTKYVYSAGRLVGTRDSRMLAVGSRLSADLVANCYDRHLREHAGGMLLDLGCGRAPLFHVYKGLVDWVVCADWLKSFHDSPYIDVACDLSSALPFKDKSFDTVILSSVLEHVPDPGLLWSEVARVLRPGGKLLLNSPFYYGIHEAPYDYYRYTEYALLRFAGSSGMETVVLEVTGGAPEVVADIVSKSLARLPVVGRSGAMFVQWLVRLIVGTPPGRKLSERTKATFPLSYFMVARRPE